MYVYSKRLSWDFSPNSVVNKIEQQRARGVELLDLTSSNPTDSLREAYPHEEIRLALAKLQNLSYAPDPIGHAPALNAVAEYYRGRGIFVSNDRMILTASTSEAYSFLFKLLCDPGDQVLIPVPSYPLFDYLARLESVHTVPYRLAYDGSWFIDFDHLRRGLSGKTRAIVIVNPNNPTGSFLKRSEWEALSAIAAEHSLPVISDEVFMDYPHIKSATGMPTLIGHDHVLSFSLNGLSKSAGMPQMKLGWIVVNGPAAERERARLRLELISDTYLSVGTPVQQALPDLLGLGERVQENIRERTAANLQALRKTLDGSSVHLLHLEGGWSAVLQVPATLSEETWMNRLLDAGVIVQPGFFYDMEAEAFLVVSLLTQEESFRHGIEIIRDSADSIRG